jgi:hypothetical protein
MKIKWYFWILFFILVVLVFPKPCGTKTISPVLDYTCIGFETPFISLIQKTEVREDWCSGICISKSKNPYIKPDYNAETAPGPLAGIIDIFIKVLPALFLILGIVVIVSFIDSIQKKGGTKITVVKGPGQ